METLRDLKEFLNLLTDNQLQMKIADNVLTPDSEENGNVESISMEIAKEDYYLYCDIIQTESAIKDEMRDNIEDEGDLENVFFDFKNTTKKERKIGDVLIIAKHY